MGLAHYLQTNFDLDNVFFSGASGGAWAALLLAANCSIESDALEALKAIGPQCCSGRWLGAYGVYDSGMRAVFEHLFNGVDLPRLVNGRLAISVTRLAFTPWPVLKDEVISHFYSNGTVQYRLFPTHIVAFLSFVVQLSSP